MDIWLLSIATDVNRLLWLESKNDRISIEMDVFFSF